jgi:hypothetical protein
VPGFFQKQWSRKIHVFFASALDQNSFNFTIFLFNFSFRSHSKKCTFDETSNLADEESPAKTLPKKTLGVDLKLAWGVTRDPNFDV